jgi:DNA-binding LytR/AlgR family response regulator
MIKRIDEVALFYIKNEIVYLVTFDGEKFPLHKKMEHLESICDPKQFYRVNRLMLLSREAIVSFESLLSRKNYLLT